ncbi:SBBP repeat-containing protein [Roseofilum capinflatum]|uniref:SBBP repeat-containing protein n=1 Tax=Roseofilum capinflatum BLCC-M114 TaxID=3022440 RepID=A0ABT7B7U3_9CYAN|nr:SBBP repeat-containing protein [Roseofilum capinflatum]MDJ1175233.1 SBBP repeat-containing protein [Roseofilum capinflatum BLCC-M114]
MGINSQLPSNTAQTAQDDVLLASEALNTAVSPEARPQFTGQRPLSFIQNNGQVDDSVSFHVRDGDVGEVFFTQEEIVVANGDDVIRANFVGSNPSAEVRGWEQLPGIANFFIGNDPSKWRTNIATFEGVWYEEVYDGIDVKYSGQSGQVKRDIYVAPGASVDTIKIAYENINDIEIREDGSLALITDTGELTEKTPIAYQIINGQQVDVDVAYKILEGNQIGFEVGSYDPNHELVLDPVLEYSNYLGGSSVIVEDIQPFVTFTLQTLTTTQVIPGQTVPGQPPSPPITITNTEISTITFEQGTYRAGATNVTAPVPAEDAGYAITVDQFGAAYVTGETFSVNFPKKPPEDTVEPFTRPLPDPTAGNDVREAFISKINNDGSLVYSTYIGGVDKDRANDIAVDRAGNAYIVGETESPDFPVQEGRTTTPFQPFAGGSQDAFVLKLNPTGTQIDYASYLGGTGYDRGSGIEIDSNGSAYITGQTTSTGLGTAGVFQQNTDPTNGSDAFVAKVNATGNQLLYFTYIGGPGFEEGIGIDVDSTGNAYISGTTQSSGLATSGTYQRNLVGSSDVFVSKINTDASQQLYFSYLGGGGGDVAGGIAVDSTGAAYVTGITPSADFPTGRNLASGQIRNFAEPTFQSEYQGGAFDAFVTKFAPNGQSLAYSTFLGGAGNEGVAFLPLTASTIGLDQAGQAYVVGTTNSASSTTFPTRNAEQPNFAGGRTDAFLTKLNRDGTNLIYSSFYGGDGDDYGYGVAVDQFGAAYTTGQTISSNLNDNRDPELPPPGTFEPPTFGYGVEDPSPARTVPFFSNTIPGSLTPIGAAVVERNEPDAFVAKFSFEGVIVTPFGGTLDITEGGVTDFIALELTTEPTAPVTIVLSPDNESTIAPNTVTFTQQNWNRPQRVQVIAVNDGDVEGAHQSTINFQTFSADPSYNQIFVPPVTANVTDNDTRVFVDENEQPDGTRGLVVSENGDTNTYTIRLAQQPAPNTTVQVVSSPDSQLTAGANGNALENAPFTLTFSPTDPRTLWNTPQTVTVGAVDDLVQEGNHTGQLQLAVTSQDGQFNNTNAILVNDTPLTQQENQRSSLTATILDNDQPDIFVNVPSGELITSEDRTGFQISARLGSIPTSDVVIPITISDPTEGNAVPASLTFTPENATQLQVVDILGVPDDIIDGNQPYVVTVAPAQSADPNYSGLELEENEFNVLNLDIDTFGVNVTPVTGLRTSEDGTTQTFDVVLSSSEAPLADVQIDFSTSNPEEGLISTDGQNFAADASLVFNAQNFNVRQTITIQGVPDGVVDGNQPYTILSTPTTSTDERFNNVPVQNVAVINEDIDSIGLNFVPTTGETTVSEDGASIEYSVSLQSSPSSDVVITVQPDVQSLVTPTVLTFNSTNYNEVQTVTITGFDDRIVEGTHSSTINFSVESGDTDYGNLTLDPVTVTVLDNDTSRPGLTPSPTPAPSPSPGFPSFPAFPSFPTFPGFRPPSPAPAPPPAPAPAPSPSPSPSLGTGRATPGNDFIDMGAFNLRSISALQGNDTVVGSPANDFINGNQGNDSLFGAAGNDFLYGGQDNDTLRGSSGNDNLNGDFGNDYLEGGTGTDNLSGGLGNDVFVLPTSGAVSTVFQADRIRDFGNGFDLIGLTDGVTQGNLQLLQTGSDTAILFNGLYLGVVERTTPAALNGRFIPVSL